MADAKCQMYGIKIHRFYCILLFFLISTELSEAADYREFLHIKRSKPHYIISAPEIFHTGDVNSVNFALTGRTGDTLVHVMLKKWHGGKVIASSSKFVPIAKSSIPLVLNLKIQEDVSERYALLIIRLLGHQYKKEERLVRIKKRPLKIFLKTNKGIYRYGDKVDLWVVVLDRQVNCVGGKVDSIMLMDSNGNVADYKRDIPLIRGIAVSNLSTENIVTGGKVELKVVVKDQEASVLLFVGDEKQSMKAEETENRYKMYRGRNLYHSAQLSTDTQGYQSKISKSVAEKLYSSSNTRIEILMPTADFKLGSTAKLIIVYNNPSNGVNTFFYQVVCSDKTLIFERFQDLYSSWTCEFQRYQTPFLYDQGPKKMDLCRMGKTWFTVTFKVTENMSPSCRFLVYRVKNEVELVAADIEFRVPTDLPRKLQVTAEKQIVYRGEKLSIRVKGPDNSIVLLAALCENEKVKEEQVLCEDTLLHYVHNRTDGAEIVKISTYCDGGDYVTAGQCFRNSGLKIITDVDADPSIPCFKGYQGVRRVRATRQMKKYPVHIAGSGIQPWIWKTIKLRKGEELWEYIFDAPKQPGKFTIEAFSMSADGKLDVAKSIAIKVKQKVKKSKNSLAKTAQSNSKMNFRDLVTLQILPSQETRFFLLSQCQPMKMKICVRPREISSKKTLKGFVVIEIDMVPGFKLADKDFKRLLRRNDRILISYFAFSNRTFMFVKQKSDTKKCFFIRLEQHEPFQKAKNSARITFYKTSNISRKMTTRYWITEKNCSFL